MKDGAIVRLALFLCVSTLLVIAPPQTDARPNGGAHSTAHVYFLTGLFGPTSRLAVLEARVRQHGLPSTMAEPGGWQELARSAIDAYRSGRLRSIVIVGYSAGAAAAIDMGEQLHAAKVPVNLVVTIDGSSHESISPNVRRLINVYVDGGYGGSIPRPNHSSARVINVPVSDPDVGHFSIIEKKQTQLLNYVLSAAAARSSAANSGQPRN